MLQDSNRENVVRHIILIEVLIKLIVFIDKGILGMSAGSCGILVIEVHSLTDLANDIDVGFVKRLSTTPVDRELSYGRRKL